MLTDFRQQRSALQDFKNKLQAVEADRDQLKGRTIVLEDEIKSLTRNLASKSEEFHKEAGQRAELERLSDLPAMVLLLEEQVNRWREKSAALDTESKRAARELANVSSERQALQLQQKEMDRAMDALRHEREEMMGRLKELELKTHEFADQLQSTRSDNEALRRDLQQKNQVVNSKTLKESTTDTETHKVRLECDRLMSLAESHQRRAALANEHLETTKQQLARTESSLLHAKTDAAAAKSENERLNQALHHLEGDLTSIRAQEKKMSIELKESEQRTRRTAASAETESRERVKLATHLEQFKSVFSKLDETRAGLETRVKELVEAIQKEKTNRMHAESIATRLQEAGQANSEKLGQFERTIRELKSTKDKLEVKLDTQSKAGSELEAAVHQQEGSYRELEQRLGAAQRQLHSQSKALDDRDVDVSSLTEQLNTCKRTTAHLEAMCNARNEELRSATVDISNMTRENQAINAGMQTIRAERDKLRVQLSDALARASRLDGLLESTKMEKADLLSVYRRACDENARSKRLLQELSTSRAQVIGEKQANIADTSRVRRMLAEREEQCRRQEVDLRAYERQVAELSRQLHVMQGKVESLEEESSDARKMAMSAKDASSSLVVSTFSFSI